MLDSGDKLRDLRRRLIGVEGQSGAVVAETLPPDPGRLIHALRQIGYSLEQALADLVDNAINAGASTVLIRFVCKADKIHRVVIADDGSGMSAKELQNAMRFGSDTDHRPGSLGKFGMGLKLAALSHARTFTVGSWRRQRSDARRWSLESIEGGWASAILSRSDARSVVRSPMHPVDISGTGTVVIWDNLDKLPVSKGGLRYTLRSFHRRIQLHLGMCFHRFLEDGRLEILIDQQTTDQPEHRLQVSINPLNPFAYDGTGQKGYPKDFTVRLDDGNRLNVEGHIWPPNSESPEYRLGNRAAARQGFYFYRNDRLIQAGGWNGMIQSEAEPHGSLARVRVDLPIDLDDAFSLNVQKSAVNVPPGFVEAVLAATSRDQVSFEDYRHHAHNVYRKGDKRATRTIPLVPGRGIPKALQRASRDVIGRAADSVRDVEVVWTDLPEEDFFQLDRKEFRILLNSHYRESILGGMKASGTDVPLIKLLLFFLLESELDRKGTSSERRQKLRNLNRLMIRTICMKTN